MIVKTLINHESYIALLCSINWIRIIENEIKFQELKLNKKKHLLYPFDYCKSTNTRCLFFFALTNMFGIVDSFNFDFSCFVSHKQSKH